jgi:DNA-binding FadR family transcriptional regulator
MFNDDGAEDVRIPKAAELVASRVRRAIATGEMKDGDSLPSETELMGKFKVSRPTVREGIRILESEGLIRVSRGARGGGRVVGPDHGIVARAAALALQTQGVTIADLYEARTLIEPPAARLAAERRPQEAGHALRAYNAQQLAVVSEETAVARAIAGFHKLLLEECGNGTLAVLGLALHDVFERALVASTRMRAPLPEPDRLRRLRFGFSSHTKLVELIAAGDGPAAEQHWKAHLEAAGKVWLKDGAGLNLFG